MQSSEKVFNNLLLLVIIMLKEILKMLQKYVLRHVFVNPG